MPNACFTVIFLSPLKLGINITTLKTMTLRFTEATHTDQDHLVIAHFEFVSIKP